MAYKIENGVVIPEIGHIVFFIDNIDGRIWKLPVTEIKGAHAYFDGEDANNMKQLYWGRAFNHPENRVTIFCGKRLHEDNPTSFRIASVSMGPYNSSLRVFFDAAQAKEYAKHRVVTIKNGIEKYLKSIDNYEKIVSTI